MKQGDVVKVKRLETMTAVILQDEEIKVLLVNNSFIVCDELIEDGSGILEMVNPVSLGSLKAMIGHLQYREEKRKIENIMKEKSDEIESKILSFYKSNPEEFKGYLCFDPGQELPIKNIKDFDSYESFIGKIEDDLWQTAIDEIAWTGKLAFENILDELDLWEKYEELDEYFQDEIKDNTIDLIKIDVSSDLEEKTNLYLNIFPFQDDNLDSEGSLLREDLFLLRNRLNGKKGSSIKKASALYKLFKSQGYNINTFKSKDVKKSKFLKSFMAEINGTREDFPVFLTFLIKTSVKEYFEILNGEKKLEITKGTCGIFNPVTGSSSDFGIKLEKPFTISFTGKEKFKGINVEKAKGYGLNASCVIGFSKDLWDAEYRLV